MNILVFSDSHGYLENMKNVLRQYEKEIKYVIHLGDYDKDVLKIKSCFLDYKFINVSGNCDFGTNLPSEKFFSLYDKRFFITHGHKYNVKYNLVKLSYSAEEKNADICLFGHTHIPMTACLNNILYMNPGSISQPRLGNSYTYGMISVSKTGNAEAKVLEAKK